MTFYSGNYDYYLEKTGTESAVAGLVADGKSIVAEKSSGSAPKVREQKRLEADARQSRSRAKQELQRDLSTIEKRILELELRQKELTGFLEQPDRAESSVHPAQTGRELTTLAQELESLSLEWERLVDIAQNI